MDQKNDSDLHRGLFSRGVDSDVPVGPPTTQSSSHLDSLFSNIRQHSEPVSPAVMIDESLSTTSPTERQSALLSLLGTTVGPVTQVPTPPGSIQRSGPSPNDSHSSENQGKILLEQLMGSASRSNYADSAGSGPSAPSPQGRPDEEFSQEEYQASSKEAQRNYHATSLFEPSSLFQHVPEQPQQHQQPQPQQDQQDDPRPSTPTRKSLFDFVSPFDALANSASSKKKPVPSAPSAAPSDAPSASSGNEDSWTSVSVPVDPKRKSVENLMDQLTRGQTLQQPQQHQPTQQLYGSYGQSPYAPKETYQQRYEPYHQEQPIYHDPPAYNQEPSYAPEQKAYPEPAREVYEPKQPREPSPAAPTPPRAPSPPRALPMSPPQAHQSPAKQPAIASRTVGPVRNIQRLPVDSGPESQPSQHEIQMKSAAARVRANDSGVEFMAPKADGRGKQGSPQPPRQNWKTENKAKLQPKKNSLTSSPQEQNIIYDVSQPLHEVLASRDLTRSTAIALVRQDMVFIPGTTIGCSHWVAYAMSKGRIRIIARASGDRTLLNLPQSAGFAPQTVVTDMAVYGNRLAAVTSDGGFLIWELPELIVDNAPGEIIFCVGPTDGPDGLRSVKFHPSDTNVLAVASRDHVFLVDVGKSMHITRGRVIEQDELHQLFDVFALDSPLAAFDFDMAHYALGTISEDSVLTLWNMQDKQPFWSHQTPVDGPASSVTFVEGGIVIGRKKNTILQLLSMSNKKVLSTVRFVNGTEEDPHMFCHFKYDSRIQTLWASNSRREGLIAFKFGYEMVSPNEEPRAFFQQVIEFPGSKPTIHFVILNSSTDPTGEEASAACEAAKTPDGELALVAFSVHSSGVDQILIRKDWYDDAMKDASSKFPLLAAPEEVPQSVGKVQRQAAPILASVPQQAFLGPPAAITRVKTPNSDDGEGENGARDAPESKLLKTPRVKNVKEKEKEKDEVAKEKPTPGRGGDASLISESALGQALTREMRRTEENLHTRIGRLISKEMDKQQQRLDDARATDQGHDLTRQETILKLISEELSRNTTRVVGTAVRSEVQNSVLPALEGVTRSEVRSALNEQVGARMTDYVQRGLSEELEKMLTRPDVASHFTNLLSSTLAPVIERQVKESVNKVFVPLYHQQAAQLHQEVLRELQNEVGSVKSGLIAWHSDVLRSQEAVIRDLESSVRALSEQVKLLTMNPPAPVNLHHQLSRSSPVAAGTQHMQHQPVRQNPVQHSSFAPSIYQQQPQHQAPLPHLQPPIQPQQLQQPQQQQQQMQQQPQPPPSMHKLPPPTQGPTHNNWYGSIAAPQASHIAALPQAPLPMPPVRRASPAMKEDWDETYLAVLQGQDANQLRSLLHRSNPEIILPLSGRIPLSQPVILTLIFRLTTQVNETSPQDESLRSSLWWLQRASVCFIPSDPSVINYLAMVVPNITQMLASSKSRLSASMSPPGAAMETARLITEIQNALSF